MSLDKVEAEYRREIEELLANAVDFYPKSFYGYTDVPLNPKRSLVYRWRWLPFLEIVRYQDLQLKTIAVIMDLRVMQDPKYQKVPISGDLQPYLAIDEQGQIYKTVGEGIETIYDDDSPKNCYTLWEPVTSLATELTSDDLVRIELYSTGKAEAIESQIGMDSEAVKARRQR